MSKPNTAISARTMHEQRIYTSSDRPWLLQTYGKKLFHYLSGGGMPSLGLTARQEEAMRREARFLTAAAFGGVLWLVLLLA